MVNSQIEYIYLFGFIDLTDAVLFGLRIVVWSKQGQWVGGEGV